MWATAEVIVERPHQQTAGGPPVQLGDEELRAGLGRVELLQESGAIGVFDLSGGAPAR